MSDVIAGQRQAIADGKNSLMWAYEPGAKAPVQPGDIFVLRSLAIEITRIHKVKSREGWWWRAEFHRFYKTSRPWLLGKQVGYVTDEREAIGTRDHPEDDERPPEPEALPPDEVRNLPSTEAARERYDRERIDRQRQVEAMPLADRVRLLEVAGSTQARRELKAIRALTQRGEAKLMRDAS